MDRCTRQDPRWLRGRGWCTPAAGWRP